MDNANPAAISLAHSQYRLREVEYILRTNVCCSLLFGGVVFLVQDEVIFPLSSHSKLRNFGELSGYSLNIITHKGLGLHWHGQMICPCIGDEGEDVK